MPIADVEDRATEVNLSAHLSSAAALHEGLEPVTRDNVRAEGYVTDVAHILANARTAEGGPR